MHTLPPVPSFDTTRLATVKFCTKLRFDAVGRGEPHGNTVTKPGRVGSVTVTFSATDVALAGTPARPATWTSTTAFGVVMPIPCCSPSAVGWPGRVSRTRAGLAD